MDEVWLNFITAFGLAAFISGTLLPIIIKIGHKRNFLSAIDFRRKNRQRVPLMGGIAIFVAVTSVSWLFEIEHFYVTLACAVPVFLIGVFDDIYQFSAKPKALVHLLAVLAWLVLTPYGDLILGKVGMSPWIAYPAMVFWMVGIINAINMIDGMDGEAGGFSLVVSLAMALVVGFSASTLHFIVLAGGCFGFLIYNWPPAKIYLGDSGSTTLGFLLATSALSLPVTGTAMSLVFIPLFLFSFPEVDALLSILRRAHSKSSLFRGDHDHIHHKLKKLGLTIPQALAVIYGATIYSGIAAYILYELNNFPLKWLVGMLATFGLLNLLGAIYFLEFRQAHQVSTVSRSIINRYLRLTRFPEVNPENFQAFVYDLLPYYKELQLRGIAEVDDFIRSFSDYVQREHPNAQYCMIGSYSIVALENANSANWTNVEQNMHAKEFYKLLQKYSVVKSESPIPWGMSFYSSQSKGEIFLRKFGLLPRAADRVQLKQVS